MHSDRSLAWRADRVRLRVLWPSYVQNASCFDRRGETFPHHFDPRQAARERAAGRRMDATGRISYRIRRVRRFEGILGDREHRTNRSYAARQWEKACAAPSRTLADRAHTEGQRRRVDCPRLFYFGRRRGSNSAERFSNCFTRFGQSGLNGSRQ